MASTSLKPPPLSIYVHLPWCEKKCPYCDFNSHAIQNIVPEHDYLEALIVDLEQEKDFIQDRPVHSIFIGGGTPSLFSPATIERLLDMISKFGAYDPEVEITLEANPGSSEVTRFAGYRAAGINRLSLGVQSFSDEKLLSLGRVHNGDKARRAIEGAHNAGFTNINIDLMFNLPHQNEGDALTDLEIGLQHSPSHISLYQLTIEPNTYFAVKPPTLPNEDTSWRIRTALYDMARTNDYYQYEVSAFSKLGSECNHNLNVWQFGDYIGVGAGAHGKISTPKGVIRYIKQKHPARYMAQRRSRSFLQNQRSVTPHDLCFEFMLNSLRLRNGFQRRMFSERTGVPWSSLTKTVDKARSIGLLETNEDHIKPTDLGYRFLDDLVELFLPEPDSTRQLHNDGAD